MSPNASEQEKYAQLNDAETWTAFKAGDVSAFEIIFRSHYNILYQYGLKMLHDPDKVKDHIQTLFTILWDSRERLGSNSCIKNYLLAALRRQILRQEKRNNRFHLFVQQIAPEYEESEEVKVVQIQTKTELEQKLKLAISSLPARRLQLPTMGSLRLPARQSQLHTLW
jgi:RNA polymerase sigma-70 factor (ECF subfamily)